MSERIMDLKFAIYGYHFIDTSILQNKNFQKCLKLIPETSFYRTSPIERKMIPKISENIINMHFKSIDRKVLFLQEEEFNIIFKEYLPSIEEYIDIVNLKAQPIDIYQLPIIYSKGNSMEGDIKKIVIDTEKIELLKKYRLVFSRIELGNQIDYLSPSTHVHEVVHGLVERNKGSVRNYLNVEVLSNFMEKVAALDMGEGLLKVIETNRLAALKKRELSLHSKEIFLEEDIENYQYLYSAFLAEQLFTLYLEGNTFLRKQILKDISKVLEGNLVVEDLLVSKEISYNNEEVVKALQKTVKERILTFS